MVNRESILYFQFCPNVPWKFITKIISPVVSREVWVNHILESRRAYILMPGYLLEVLTTLMAPKVLKENGITISKWIVPGYYDSLLKYFNIKTLHANNDNTLAEEYKRMFKATKSYPVPIFFNGGNDIYFNLLNNYGFNRKNNRNKRKERLPIPFWKQLLCNTCCNNFRAAIFPKFGLEELVISKNQFFQSKGLNVGKYLLIDNTISISMLSDFRPLNHKLMNEYEIQDLSLKLKKCNTKCIVMTNESIHNTDNVCYINPWDKIDSLQLVSLLLNAECIISSDPNIYLSAALLGCKKIINLDTTAPKGWNFEDVPDSYNKDIIWHTPNVYNTDYFCDIVGKELNGR